MVEMAHGLPYKHEDHTTAIKFIDAQLEKINSQAVFAREHERLEMIRVLHAARVEAGNGKDLDMEFFTVYSYGQSGCKQLGFVLRNFAKNF